MNQFEYDDENVLSPFTKGHVLSPFTKGHVLSPFTKGHVLSPFTKGHDYYCMNCWTITKIYMLQLGRCDDFICPSCKFCEVCLEVIDAHVCKPKKK
jgi:hypothetical protein